MTFIRANQIATNEILREQNTIIRNQAERLEAYEKGSGNYVTNNFNGPMTFNSAVNFGTGFRSNEQ